MAIDTAAKRAAAMAVGAIGMAIIYPDANDLEHAQRMASNGLYSGITDEGSAVGLTSQPRIHIGLGLGI